MKYFAYDLSVDGIVNELYDMKRSGMLSYPLLLTESGRQELLTNIKLAQHLFTPAAAVYGVTKQNMNTLYLDNNDLSKLPEELRASLNGFRQEYNVVHQQIAKKAKFKIKDFNSIGIHQYPLGAEGIAPHRDFKQSVNLITIFVLEGWAPVYSCKDRTLEGAVAVDRSPGTVIFMRAARNEKEQEYRPFHAVGAVNEERYSLIFRTDDLSLCADKK